MTGTQPLSDRGSGVNDGGTNTQIGGTASQVVAVGVAGPGIVITNNPAVSSVNKALTLTSAPADDGETTPSAFAWTLTLNGNSYPVANAAGSPLTFTPTQNGLFAITLTATFAPGVVSTTTAYLVVTGGVPATSIAGAPKSALEGTPITLAATADPSLSGTLTYIWTVTKNGATFATQTDTRADVFSFTPDSSASYQAFLTIKDAVGDTSSAPSVTIPVTAVPPTSAITQFPTGATAGTQVQLAGSGSTPGTADAVTGLAWSVYSGGAVR